MLSCFFVLCLDMFNSVIHHHLTEEIRRVHNTLNNAEIADHLVQKYKITKSLAFAAIHEFNFRNKKE